jgi:hypothetical protein
VQHVTSGQLIHSVGASLSEDGQLAELQFVRANGQIAYIQFPAAMAGPMFVNIEEALAKVFEMQRALLKGNDPRLFFQVGMKRVTKVHGAIGDDGTPLLSFVLQSGMRIDLGMPKDAIPNLISWLRELEALRREPGSEPH